MSVKKKDFEDEHGEMDWDAYHDACADDGDDKYQAMREEDE